MTTQVVCGCDRPSSPEGGREGGSGPATRAGWEEPRPRGGTEWGGPADHGEGDPRLWARTGVTHTPSTRNSPPKLGWPGKLENPNRVDVSNILIVY